MTIQELQEYRGMSAEVQAIQDELVNLYTPISSPLMSDSHGTTPGNPTEKAVLRIMALQEMISKKREVLAERLEAIEKWLDELSDSEIASIVRWHYLLGMNWKQTNQKVYGYPDYYYSRKKIERYFTNENIKP